MNNKKPVILAITLVMMLSITSMAYAFTLGGQSSITTGIITVTGKSTSTCSVAADNLYVDCSLYRDDIFLDNSTSQAYNVKSISTSQGGQNLPGSQHWEAAGYHWAYVSGQEDACSSYATTNY